MTRSDKIIEFLKYASPRLDYIEHCMEKQALSPTRALQAIKAFRARASTGAIDPSKYKRLGALSKSVGKLKGKEKNQLNNVAGKLHKKYYDGKYVKGDYSRVQQRAATPSVEEAFFNQYGRMPDQDMINASTVPAAKPKVNVPMVGNDIPGMPRPGTGEMLMRNVADNTAPNFIPDNVSKFNNALQKLDFEIPGMPRPGTGEMLMRDAPQRAEAARKAFLNDMLNPHKPGQGILRPGAPADAIQEVAASEPGMWDNITAWMKEHPYLTAGGGLAAGAAGGAGVGYGVGSSSGKQEGSQIAQRYYELREALDRQRLQRTNDSFLSRLGNLFGAGDLSNLIG